MTVFPVIAVHLPSGRGPVFHDFICLGQNTIVAALPGFIGIAHSRGIAAGRNFYGDGIAAGIVDQD